MTAMQKLLLYSFQVGRQFRGQQNTEVTSQDCTLSGDEHPHVPKACFTDWGHFLTVHLPPQIPAGQELEANFSGTPCHQKKVIMNSPKEQVGEANVLWREQLSMK